MFTGGQLGTSCSMRRHVKEGHTSHCTGLMGEVNSPFGLFHIEICRKLIAINRLIQNVYDCYLI